MYHIQIVGAGYVGTALVQYFRAKNQKVWALTRTPKRREALETLGATPLVADLTQPGTLENIPPAHFIVLSPAPSRGDEENYRKVYLEGIGNYLAAIRKNPKPFLIVYLSSTGVYSQDNGEWVDESTDPAPKDEKGRTLLEAETQVLKSGFPAIIFRLAGIYGPGRDSTDRVRKTQWPLERDQFVNMIHLEDIVGAMPVIFNQGEAGSVYLGVDDEPVRRSEFYAWLAEKFSIPLPPGTRVKNTSSTGGKRCRNARLKSLGFTSRFPTFREGYQ